MPPHHDPIDVDGDVYVSPRSLARSTLTGDPALAPLLDRGWDLQHDDLANVYVDAPDRRLRLGYLPEGKDDGLWRINAYKHPFGPPTWGVCFNNRAPTELVTAFTMALAEAYEQGPHSYLASPALGSKGWGPFMAVAPLINRGWIMDGPRNRVITIDSPDGLARLDYTTGALPEDSLAIREARWHLWAGSSLYDPYWYATASTETPVALLKAVAECVSDPAPLPRWRDETHSYVEGVADLTPALPPSRSASTPRDVRRTAASRRPAMLPAPSAPSRTTHLPALPGPHR
ncbi:conserved protein of unknown function [Streptomyces murinus]|uniref:DUF317 domain-containing protein n=1 Tax=Streptomyces murinus TaxID=33900 RepID=UPI003D6674A3